jgi:hypothetical protein
LEAHDGRNNVVEMEEDDILAEKILPIRKKQPLRRRDFCI